MSRQNDFEEIVNSRPSYTPGSPARTVGILRTKDTRCLRFGKDDSFRVPRSLSVADFSPHFYALQGAHPEG